MNRNTATMMAMMMTMGSLYDPTKSMGLYTMSSYPHEKTLLNKRQIKRRKKAKIAKLSRKKNRRG